ncbi:MAG: carboxypeptidase M32 [Myxococcota bacterium]
MHEIKDIDGVLGLLEWEEETYAPDGARTARGPQVATIEALRHRKLTDPQLEALLREAEPTNEEDAVLIRRLQRHVDRATKTPERLVKAIAEARSAAMLAWQQARADSNFALFAPHLKTLLPLLREKAEALGEPETPIYDVLLDEYEPEMTTAQLKPVLSDLQQALVPIVQVLSETAPPPHEFATHHYDDNKQWQFTLRLLKDLGFDFSCGRQDRSAHPFTSTVNEKDVRVTTRIETNNLLSGISSTIHECGHALYEQGFASQHHRTYLAEAPSMGIHESQSRLWENQVGMSRPFWTHYLPILKKQFPEQLEKIDIDTFWRGINRVKPSMIRVDADEVTYNLHIVLRFELELALINDDLSVDDLPGAWNDKMERLLGIRPRNDAEGCLQDIHWASGAFGYFPTYTIGNLYAAQLFGAFQRSQTNPAKDFSAGRFRPLLDWLRKNVHHRGHTASAQKIVADAAGEKLSMRSFVEYLRAKYSEVYRVKLG